MTGRMFQSSSTYCDTMSPITFDPLSLPSYPVPSGASSTKASDASSTQNQAMLAEAVPFENGVFGVLDLSSHERTDSEAFQDAENRPVLPKRNSLGNTPLPFRWVTGFHDKSVHGLGATRAPEADMPEQGGSSFLLRSTNKREMPRKRLLSPEAKLHAQRIRRAGACADCKRLKRRVKDSAFKRGFELTFEVPPRSCSQWQRYVYRNQNSLNSGGENTSCISRGPDDGKTGWA